MSILIAGLVLGVLALDFVWASRLGASGLFGVYRSSAAAFILKGDAPYAQYGSGGEALPPTLLFYPLYALLFLGPFALVPNVTIARGLWMLVLEICIAGSTWLGLQLIGWQPRSRTKLAIIAGALLSYPSVRAVGMGSLVPLAGFFLVAALWFIKTQNDEVAGALLAASLVSPTVLAPAVVSVVIWALSRRRGAIVAWLIGVFALMVGFSAVFLLDWPMLYWKAFSGLMGEAAPATATLDQALKGWLPGIGARLSLSISTVVGAIYIAEWWLVARTSFVHLTWDVALVLVAMQWMMVPTDSSNAVVFLLPCLLFLFFLGERWRLIGRWTGWGILGVLWVVAWVRGLQGGMLAPSKDFLIAVIPGVLLIGLYWVRWWAVQGKESLDTPPSFG